MVSREEKSRAEQVIVEEFIKDLEQTAQQVQLLLTEIRDSKIDAATIKSELNFLVENVKQLSTIIRDGGNAESVLTRLALLEQSIKEIKDYITKDSAADSKLITRVALLEQKFDLLSSKKEAVSKRNPKTSDGRWRLYIAIITIIGSIIIAMLQL